MTTQNQQNSSEFWNNINDWVSYWRLNIHRFIVEYLHWDIAIFQQILLYLMDFPTTVKKNKISISKETKSRMCSFIWFASRGLGKTFLTMMFCVAKCILYPGIKIMVASATIKQALKFIEKIYEIKDGHPNIEREIDSIKTSKDNGSIRFKNGSVIEAVVCSDSARGGRANIVIYDESRLMSKEIISKVINPYLTLNNRGQLWATSPKWKEYLKDEHNTKIFLTSIGYKDEWSYKDFEEYIKYAANGDEDYCAISLPYQFGIEAGFINEGYIETEIRESASDIHRIKMEFEVIPYGESEHSMFKFDELNKARKLRVPLIPPTDDEYIEIRGDIRKHQCYQKKDPEEIRVISMDIAVSAGRTNDNTVFIIFRLTPNGNYYDKEVAYIETMNGVNLDPQIVRLKQLFYDLECDYCVIDAMGALGINAVNTCGQITRDIVRNKKYPGWKTINQIDKFDSRVSDQNAVPVLYTIQVAGLAAGPLQYSMLVTAQLEFERNRILLLTSEEDVLEELNRRYGYMKLKTSNNYSDRERAEFMISSFKNTDELINEAISTQVTKTQSGRFTFDEKNGRKDRIISMIYGLYFINILEEDLQSKFEGVNIYEYFNQSESRSNFKPINSFTNNFSKLNGFGARR